MSKLKILIDAGHGSIDSNGKYTTDPKKGKLFKYPDFTIYEGVTNRAIARLLMLKLQMAGYPYSQIHEEVADVSLTERAKKANVIYAREGNCLYLSIHSNAGGGKGFEVFTSQGQTKSDWYADFFIDQFKKDFPEYPMRSDNSDGDLDKEENFTVLSATNCPAILVELLFFDERKQAEYLMSQAGQEKLADSMFKAIQKIQIKLSNP
jgi:N-acetylmuramoyl-L-alanine amidase